VKRLMVGLAAGALVAAMVPGVASASDPGCPPGGNNIPKPAADNPGDDTFAGWVAGWYLQEVTEFAPGADRGNALDKNGDGLICTKIAVGLSKRVGYTAFVAMDNELPDE